LGRLGGILSHFNPIGQATVFAHLIETQQISLEAFGIALFFDKIQFHGGSQLTVHIPKQKPHFFGVDFFMGLDCDRFQTTATIPRTKPANFSRSPKDSFSDS